MSNEKRILVASDLTESSIFAENRAAKLCQRFGLSEFELVHVQDTGFSDMLGKLLGGDSEKTQQVIFERVSADFKVVQKRILDEFGIHASLKMLFGRPSAEIVRYAAEQRVDLIVVGAKRPGINKNFFLGNTPDRMLHVTPAPLLIVRQPPVNYYQNVLIPVDFSENAIYAAKIGVDLLMQGTKKTLLHAYNVPHEGLMGYANVSHSVIKDFRSLAKQDAEDKMEELVMAVGGHDQVSHLVLYGNVLQIIDDYVSQHHPDLIIMGKQGRSNLENMLLGKITRNTINETTCDVLVVPLKQ